MTSISTAAPRYFVDKMTRSSGFLYEPPLDTPTDGLECRDRVCPTKTLERQSASDIVDRAIDVSTTRIAGLYVDGISSPVNRCICRAFRESGYPLQNVDCWCDDNRLILRGRVTRYYFAQIALEIAMKYADERRIQTCIDVVPLADQGVRDC